MHVCSVFQFSIKYQVDNHGRVLFRRFAIHIHLTLKAFNRHLEIAAISIYGRFSRRLYFQCVAHLLYLSIDSILYWSANRPSSLIRDCTTKGPSHKRPSSAFFQQKEHPREKNEKTEIVVLTFFISVTLASPPFASSKSQGTNSNFAHHFFPSNSPEKPCMKPALKMS